METKELTTCGAPFPYLGGKSKIVNWIYQFMPSDVLNVIDAFGGAGNFILGYEGSGIRTFNDLNLEVFNFMFCLRNKPDELLAAIELTLHHREEYNLAFVINELDSDIERARKTFVKVSQSIGRSLVKSGWSSCYVTKYRILSPSTQKIINKSERLAQVVQVLKFIQLENLDYRALFKKYDRPGSFFYLDPPYLGSERTGFIKYGSDMHTEFEHLELIKWIKSLKTDKWILSCYDSELYRTHLDGYDCFSLNTQANFNRERVETIYVGPYYKNMQKKQLNLF